MNKGAFHSSGRLDVQMLIGRFRLQRFVFTADSTPFDVTAFAWSLNIKRNEGAYNSLLTLSIGSGLAFPIYETNSIEARFEAAQVGKTTFDEGLYYWELVRTDTNEIWISGHLEFKYGLLDSSGADQDVTVNLSDATVSIELQAIVQVTEISGGGGSSYPQYRGNYTTLSSTGFPTTGGSGSGGSFRVGDHWRVVLDAPYTPVTINGITYEHNYIIEYAGSGNWISYTANYGSGGSTPTEDSGSSSEPANRGNWTSLESSTFPSTGGSGSGGALRVGDHWRLVFTNTAATVTINGIPYNHNFIIEYAGSGYWISYPINYGN